MVGLQDFREGLGWNGFALHEAADVGLVGCAAHAAPEVRVETAVEVLCDDAALWGGGCFVEADVLDGDVLAGDGHADGDFLEGEAKVGGHF